MRKLFMPFAMILALVLSAGSSYAAKVCLQDNFGSYWELKGGRIDKKSYTTKKILPGTCVQGGYADVTLTNSGTLVISFYDSHSTNGACQVVFWTANTNLLFAGSGDYDIWGDGSSEGTFTVTPVSCSVLPPTTPNRKADKKYRVDPNHPAIVKR